MFRKMFPRRKQKSHSHIYPVVVTSYGICMNDYKLLADKEWKFLVVDEGHRIKNLNCKLIRFVFVYTCTYDTHVNVHVHVYIHFVHDCLYTCTCT